MTCIVGAIMYCTASLVIPGKLGYAPSVGGQAWAYAAYYQPPIINQGGVIALPGYANPNPIVFPTIAASRYGRT